MSKKNNLKRNGSLKPNNSLTKTNINNNLSYQNKLNPDQDIAQYNIPSPSIGNGTKLKMGEDNKQDVIDLENDD